jgi:hypothetical protein
VNPEASTEVFYLTNVFQTLGILVREQLIDPKFIYRNYPRGAIGFWNRLKPYVLGIREVNNNPNEYDTFEWLANKMKELQKKESEQS